MDIDWGDWGPPLAVFVMGAVGAALTLSRQGSSSSAQVEAERRRNDLQSTRDEVVEALKNLELDQAKMDPAEYAAERERLLARGARAIEALETGTVGGDAPAPAPAPAPAAAPAAAAPPPAPAGLAPEWKGALYALGAVALGWVLWTFAQDNSRDRGGGSMTGSLPGEDAMQQQQQQDPTQTPQFKAREEQLNAALAANPNDAGVLVELTQLYLSHGVPEKALQYNDMALKVDSKNLDARTQRALLTAMMGMMDKALVDLEGVLADDPNHPKATAYKGLILLETQQFEQAAAALEKAVELDPNSPQLRAALNEARTQAAGGPPPPMPGAGGDVLAKGTVVIDPAAQATLKGTETLFLSLATPGRPGPPVAADVVQGPLSFPMPFDLTTADIRAMPGSGDVPAVMDLKVRVDLDGNAMTKEPGTPSALVTGVSRGTDGLVVTLTLDGATSVAPAGGPPPAPAGNPLLAPVAPPSGGGGAVLASGTATLDPARAAEAAGKMVFLSVRDPAGGPPIAAKKLMSATFPLQFEITEADIVQMGMARPVPGTFNVSVRLDADGNAMTKAGEPEALATGVSKGSSGLSLVLK
ncbi:MAG: tetratricopeptide repeat protein [Alphaproteobacteria bacterium]|nr:tetratricopeptide repeat protein [Alphaproteobacteria bacterium]MCB9697972.1 tetratricopeptide repeat protein [Alphaproteobacteria bacterium]